MVETELETVEIDDRTLKRLFSQGVRDWFPLGLKFSQKNSWKGEFWILDVVNKQKFLLAKIRYEF
jgi:hypothetical protein